MTNIDPTTSERILHALDEATEKLEQVKREKSEPIAIVGLSCRFPGASSPEEFWRNLAAGKDCIREIPETRWYLEDHFAPNPPSPGKMYCRHGGFLTDVEGFDASLFRISPREATSMDPQQRILLEVTWEALERAGQNPRGLAGSSTSVHIGVTTQDYRELLQANPEPDAIDTYYASGNAPNALAGRISYSLGLNGPSLVVDTACSSSLVAVHLACQALRTRESDLAIAGGSNLVLSPQLQIALCQASMLSRSGRCRTFSSEADGYVRGEGCGVLVLKRLSDAIDDQDIILAQIRGSAVNQDGATAGFTVPNGPAQESVIRKALSASNLSPKDVDYLEAHGTGTPLGDPIEINAASRVYGEERDPERPLLVGSVKTNVGHLEASAGVAGLIKIVLALQAGSLPPHLHFKEPNPDISWNTLPVRITDRSTTWEKTDSARIAAISSFGASGTNAHAIVEEAPSVHQSANEHRKRVEHVLVISADSQEALEELINAYQELLHRNPSISIPDLCYTAATRRAHLRHRRAIWGSSASELQENLAQAIEGGESPEVVTGAVSPNADTADESQPAALDARSAGHRFVAGLYVAWHELYPDSRPIQIPTYPFQHVAYWVPVTKAQKASGEILYQSDWEPTKLSIASPPPSLGSWILVADDPARIETLGRVLTQTGHRVITVETGSTQEGGASNVLRDNLAETLSQVSETDTTRVLYFPEIATATDQLSGESLARAATEACLRTVELFRALAEQSPGRNTRAWIVTRQAQSLQPRNDAGEVGLASVWGLGRTIATEHPELFGGLIDLDDAINDVTANRLIDHISPEIPQLRLTKDQAWLPRIRRTAQDTRSSGPNAPIRDESTYLVTGGLGALGLEVARWLVNKGARDIVLLSRSGERPETAVRLEAIRSLGARVWAPQIDVTSIEQVRGVLEEIQTSYSPLRGVFHLAGLLDDRIVSRLDADSIDRVMQPKVAGSWNLHIATRDLSLEHFVLFSSLASWMGPAGQGNYSAANAFLDALTRHRIATGLPSLTVSWGPWSGSGMWDSLDRRDQSNAHRSGIDPLTPTSALQALETVLDGAIPETIAARIDWEELFVADRPSFLRDWAARLGKSDSKVTDEDFPSVLNLLSLDPKALKQTVEEAVAAMLAGILRLDSPDPIDTQRPLDDYGLDSLTATELRNKVATRFQVALPVAELLGGRSAADVSRILLTHLDQTETGGTHLAKGEETDTVEILI